MSGLPRNVRILLKYSRGHGKSGIRWNQKTQTPGRHGGNYNSSFQLQMPTDSVGGEVGKLKTNLVLIWCFDTTTHCDKFNRGQNMAIYRLPQVQRSNKLNENIIQTVCWKTIESITHSHKAGVRAIWTSVTKGGGWIRESDIIFMA